MGSVRALPVLQQQTMSFAERISEVRILSI
jgi:hypothetical protein